MARQLVALFLCQYSYYGINYERVNSWRWSNTVDAFNSPQTIINSVDLYLLCAVARLKWLGRNPFNNDLGCSPKADELKCNPQQPKDIEMVPSKFTWIAIIFVSNKTIVHPIPLFLLTHSAVLYHPIMPARSSTLIVSGCDGSYSAHRPGLSYITRMALLDVSLIKLDLKGK